MTDFSAKHEAVTIQIQVETSAALGEYAAIPIAFQVRSRLRVQGAPDGGRGIQLVEEPEDRPYWKDYDAIGVSPLDWASRWDISQWGVIVARDGAQALGGAVAACRTAGPYELDGREDLAALVDLRVKPQHRREGIGRQLLVAATAWATQRCCRELKIETQDINVAACRLYAACGCRLRGIHPGAYPEFPDEMMLLWYLHL